MKKLKITIIALFAGLIFLNFMLLSNTANAKKEIPDDTYYCWHNVSGGVGFIRMCSACNIFPFAYPQLPDGMCWTGTWEGM